MSETNGQQIHPLDALKAAHPGYTLGIEADESAEIDKLAAALAKAQGAFKAAPKDSKNDYFGSKYADLASVMSVVREPLSANGLAITQRLTSSSDGVVVTTMLMHASGQWMRDRLEVRVEQNVSKDGKKQAWVQAFGSAVTYIRRYAISSMLGVAADEDDDGNSAGDARTAKPAAKSNGSRTEQVKAQLAPTPWEQIRDLLKKAGKDGDAASSFLKGLFQGKDRNSLTAADVVTVSDALEALRQQAQAS